MLEHLVVIIEILTKYTFYYPLIMSMVWICGAVHFYIKWERKDTLIVDLEKAKNMPSVTVLIPCFNEGKIAEETISFLDQVTYPKFEVIAINDGSSDNTAEVLNELAGRYEWLRVIHLKTNSGKAMALRAGAAAAKSEILLGIDGDALLDPDAVYWMADRFKNNPRLGAVSGNPRIRNRSELLGKIQVGEFSSIVGLIKRAQRVWGNVFTVSGVCTAFRKTALHDVGYWRPDMLTEDVDISWRLQLRHWQIQFEPRAVCWILMPDTFTGLWSQRLRWARGGSEVLIRYFRMLFRWQARRLWPLYLEYLMGIAWGYSMAISLLYWLGGTIFGLSAEQMPANPLPDWSGAALSIAFMLQTLFAMYIDYKYDKGIFKQFFWMIWFPCAFWMISGVTAIVGFYQALSLKRLTRATWTSPDRGGDV